MAEKSEKSAEVAMTSEVALREASSLIRQLAGTGRPGESVKSALGRVGRHLKQWKPSRIRSIWYEDPRARVRADEIAQLRALTKPNQRTSSDELEELRSRISRLERLLVASDEAFHSETLAVLRDQERQVG